MTNSFTMLAKILSHKEKLQVIILLFIVIIMAFSQALGVASIMPFISLIMDPDLVYQNEYLNWAYNYFSFADAKAFIIAFGILMLLIIIISNAVTTLSMYARIRFTWMNNHRLSSRLLEKYLSRSYDYFLNKHSTTLSKNVLSEVNHLTTSFIIPLLLFVSNGILLLFIMGMLLFVNVTTTLIVLLIFGGLYGVLYAMISKKLKIRGSQRIESNRLRFKIVGEVFSGIKATKLMQREFYFLSAYRNASLEHVKQLTWVSIVGHLPKYALEAFAFGGLTVYILILLITNRDVQQAIPLAALYAFAGYRMMPAIHELFNAISQMQFNKEVLLQIYEDIYDQDTNGGLLHKELPEPLRFHRDIHLNKTIYYYPGSDKPVINNINLLIKINTTVAFVGTTGSGKTTIADIILGLLIPQAGELRIDGLPIKNEEIKRWQRNLGYVPQHIYLSDASVAQNIAFGIPDHKIDMDKVQEVAQIANLHDFIIRELPKGYETNIGERGIRLSGGQCQRIGIARALYYDPEVLVFDEATSALDGVTEDAVIQAINKNVKFKTIIYVAHRMTTVKDCDEIFLIDQGRLVDSGNYDELYQKNSHFRAMVNNNLESTI